MLDWLFGYDDGDDPLASGRIAGTARLSLDTGPDAIASQNVSQSFALPGVLQSFAPRAPSPAVSGNFNRGMTNSTQQLLILGGVALLVWLIVKG